MTEELEGVDVDPYYTPVDELPYRAAWALIESWAEQNGEDLET